ncbi:putative peptidase S54 family protein [Kitasatospora cheerisanensis KCTC 2395]|uniref:Putative peptidase S54 family protein n=2 Tax=Kitasatospora cheerisanensis TaxID=81942 RepID=A0A066YXX3_9ACTN|nr:putative peptidase S54 family protein [Kitasatospora cheerisanensis KCTC 2395]
MLTVMVLSAPARAGSPAAERAARTPVVSYLLIALSALVLIVGPSGPDPSYGGGDARACAEQRYEHRWGAVPAELLSGSPLTAAQLSALPPAAPGCVLPPTPGKVPELSVLTSLFVHAGWLHLIGNLLFLFVFGPAVESRLGRFRFLTGYLAIGYLATYGYAVAEAHTADGMRALVGASGAIAGVLGAYLRLWPRARVTALVPVLLFLPLRLPAWLVLGLWFALQGWSVGAGGNGVAYLVHVIGFVTGWLFAWAARPAGDTLGAPSRTGVAQ